MQEQTSERQEPQPEPPVEELADEIANALDDLARCATERTTVRDELAKTKNAKKRSTFAKDLEVADLRVGEALGKLAETTSLQLATACLDILEDPQHSELSTDEVYAEALKGLPKPETTGPEYPHCTCGAVLALDAEKARGVRRVRREPLPETAAPTTGEAQPPQDVPLPFPPPPVEPFDFQAAAVDVFKQNRMVESMKRVYDEAAESAKDAKKQWEAAWGRLGLLISDYDRRAREAAEANQRRAELQRCYQEQLEVAAATGEEAEDLSPATDDEDCCGAHSSGSLATMVCTRASHHDGRHAAHGSDDKIVHAWGDKNAKGWPEERAADPAAPLPELPAAADPTGATPLSDALPACACGHALALDTEKARGTCDPCAGIGQL